MVEMMARFNQSIYAYVPPVRLWSNWLELSLCIERCEALFGVALKCQGELLDEMVGDPWGLRYKLII